MTSSYPTLRFHASWLAAFLALVAMDASAQAIVPVSTSAGLQQAINSAADGSVIELASGTYNAPNGGFTVYSPNVRFTIRAAPGGNVTFNGGGTTEILRFTNSQKPITFQGISFLSGVSSENYIGGAVTLDHADAIFISCTFQNNVANGSSGNSITGGGGMWINDSKVLLQSCIFTGNSSPNYGAGLSALSSEIYINGCRFSNNRANLTGHHANSAGGAIIANSCLLRIANSKFENNQAGLVGGAIYAYGPFRDPLSTPVTRLIVANSTFTGNIAARDAGGPVQSPPVGGAVFIEDQTTAQFFNCRFNANNARQGGALGSYRGIMEVIGCVFKDNQATGTAADESIGGAIIALSSDNRDGSTDNGRINRRSAQLTVRDTLIQGVPGINSAGRGGGIFAAGDLAAAYGLAPFAQNGTIESNRAVVTLTRVAFVNLSAIGDNALGSGLGGAFQADIASLTADNVIVANCSASNYGGGFRFSQNCAVTIRDSTIAQVTAGHAGAGLTMFSGSLNLTNCNFVQNQLTIGNKGSAITTGPQETSNIPALDVTGVLTNCVFSNNSPGPVIYDGEPSRTGPYNRVQYSSNQFVTAANDAYYSDVVGPQSVAQLNALSIPRADGSVDKKAPSPNTALGTAPSVGAILMLPPNSMRSGDPDEATPIPANLAFASNGAGGVSVDGVARTTNFGVIPNVADGAHSLTVGANSFATVPPPASALNIATRLPVGAGQNVLIGGFIIVGPTPKRVLIRALGPSLPLAGSLADPLLEVHDGTGAIVATNNNWRTTSVGGLIPSNQVVELHSTTIPPARDEEAALIVNLNPGAYTAVVGGANGSTGIGLVEVYDLDAVQDSTLANISTRGFIQTGNDVMIGGMIYLGGPGLTKVVVRGIGPSLGAVGITNALSDPILELKDANGTTVEANDNWGQSPQAGAIQAAGLQPSNPLESTIYRSGLPLGPYTAILRGVAGTGVGVVEVYVFQ
jgi:hypothetical protein